MKVTINRKQSIQKMLEATNRIQYIEKDVLATFPKYKTKTVELEFFKLDKYITCQELQDEFDKRGLIPDPQALLQLAVDNQGFLDEEKYVVTQWKDNDGKWCYTAFTRWDDERDVFVSRRGNGWYDDWWFAGVRKSGTRSLDSSDLKPLDTLPLELVISGGGTNSNVGQVYKIYSSKKDNLSEFSEEMILKMYNKYGLPENPMKDNLNWGEPSRIVRVFNQLLEEIDSIKQRPIPVEMIDKSIDVVKEKRLNDFIEQELDRERERLRREIEKIITDFHFEHNESPEQDRLTAKLRDDILKLLDNQSLTSKDE